MTIKCVVLHFYIVAFSRDVFENSGMEHLLVFLSVILLKVFTLMVLHKQVMQIAAAMLLEIRFLLDLFVSIKKVFKLTSIALYSGL